jgi:hypothetical protein
MPQYRLESPEGKIVNIEYEGELTDDIVSSVFNDPSVKDRGLTRNEFYNKWENDKQKSFSTKAFEFGQGAWEGVKGLADTLWEGIKESPELISKKGLKSAREGGVYGTIETGKMMADIWGEAVDLTVSEEEEKEREYLRYLRTRDFEREKQYLLESGEVNPELFNLSNVVLDATNVTGAGLVKAGATSVAKGIARQAAKKIPISAAAGIAKGTSKIGEFTEWVASRPRTMTQAAVRKMTAGMDAKKAKAIQERANIAYNTVAFGGGSLAGMSMLGPVGSIPYIPGLLKGLGTAEVASRVLPAVNIGLELGAEALEVLSKPSTHKRFLDKIASDTNAFKSMPWARQLPRLAHKYGGTKLAEKSFDMMVDGLSIGSIQAALAFAAGADAKEAGQAFGGGALIGGGASLTNKVRASQQAPEHMFNGDSPTRETLNVIDNFSENVGEKIRRGSFSELPIQAKAVIASMDEFGVKREGMSTEIIPDKLYNEMYSKSGRKQGELAYYDPESNALLINQDKIKKANPNQIIEQLYGKYVESHLRSVLDTDMAMAMDFENFFKDAFGEDVKKRDGSTVKLSKEVIDFRDKYNSTVSDNRKITYSDEILSTLGSRMMAQNLISGKSPKSPLGARLMSNSVGRFLNRIGLLNRNMVKKAGRFPDTLLKNKAISDIYNRHVDLQNQARNMIAFELEKDEKAINFGSLKKNRPNSKLFIDKNKALTRKQVMDSIWKIGERHVNIDEFTGLGREYATRNLDPEIFDVYNKTKNGQMYIDRFRLIQDAMDNNLETFFGYANQVVQHDRDWVKPRHWTPFFWEISNAKRGKSKGGIKVQGYDMQWIGHNVQTLIDSGIINENKNVYMNKIKDKAQEIKSRPKMADEFKQNKIEDEVMCAVFGCPSDKIKNPKLKLLMETPKYKLKNPIRSAFVDDIVALDLGGRGAQLPYYNMYNNE